MSWIGQSYHYDTTGTVDVPRILLMMDKLLELDETFNYGAPHALTAAYYSARPLSAGGNPEKAKYHFEKAFEISESKFLVWHYLYAKYYAVQNQDRKLFESTLNDIISAPVDLFPEKRFANEAVKLKAKHLLAQADILFNFENPDMAVFYYIVPEKIH